MITPLPPGEGRLHVPEHPRGRGEAQVHVEGEGSGDLQDKA